MKFSRNYLIRFSCWNLIWTTRPIFQNPRDFGKMGIVTTQALTRFIIYQKKDNTMLYVQLTCQACFQKYLGNASQRSWLFTSEMCLFFKVKHTQHGSFPNVSTFVSNPNAASHVFKKIYKTVNDSNFTK